MFKKIFILIALSVLAMGQTQCDANLRQNLVVACNGEAVIYAHYIEVRNTGSLSERYTKPAEFAHDQVQLACANPSAATTASVTAAIASAYMAYNAAFKAAPSATASVGYQKTQELKKFLQAVQQ